ncbi:MAG: hypothetical protein IJ846_00620 [Alphaproteobacteria bacterium]|nr:hypothetical protein [Alphaproteobacteria bacterium]
MKIKALFGIILTVSVLGLCACRNQYEVPSYIHTDSFGSVFEGHRIPQDIR